MAAGSSPAGVWGVTRQSREVNLAAQLPPFPASWFFGASPDRASKRVLGANRISQRISPGLTGSLARVCDLPACLSLASLSR